MRMTFIPSFAPDLLIFVLITFMGAWDGLVRRHVRFTLQVRSTDLHLRGLPAIAIGLLSAGAFYVIIGVGSNQLRLVSQECAGDWGCVAHVTLDSLFFSGGGSLLALLVLVVFILW
jgi:hypothetical protein